MKIWFLSHIDLQAERARAGLTQKELARMSGIHVQTVKYWEGQKEREGQGGFFSSACEKMAKAMELDPIEGAVATYLRRPPSRDILEQLGLVWLYEKPKIRHRHCDARLPKGTKCRKSPIKGKRRCAQHGGFSTGPKTEAGKLAISKAQHLRWTEARSQ